MCYNGIIILERGIPMDENKDLELDPQAPEDEARQQPGYVPRPKWQLAIAWILVVLMVIGVAGYYYWIAHRY